MTGGFYEYPCFLCNHTSLFKENLWKHIKTKHRVNHSCNECEYKTGDRGDLITHKVRYHEKQKTRSIDLSKILKLEGYQKKQKTKSLDLSKLEGYNCEKCDFKSTYRSSFYSHTKNKHEGRKFQCDHCNYKATQKGILVKHVKSVHDGLRYPCKKCNFSATQKDKLAIHFKSKHGVVKKQILDVLLHGK